MDRRDMNYNDNLYEKNVKPKSPRMNGTMQRSLYS